MMLQSSCLLQAPKSTPRGWMMTPPCTMQQTTGTSRLVFAGLYGWGFFNDFFFFFLCFQAASCTDTNILSISLSFAADSYIAGGSSLPHSAESFSCVGGEFIPSGAGGESMALHLILLPPSLPKLTHVARLCLLSYHYLLALQVCPWQQAALQLEDEPCSVLYQKHTEKKMSISI